MRKIMWTSWAADTAEQFSNKQLYWLTHEADLTLAVQPSQFSKFNASEELVKFVFCNREKDIWEDVVWDIFIQTRFLVSTPPLKTTHTQ